LGDLTEREIFDCLEENFRLAAQNAEKLAHVPNKGPVYAQFRSNHALIEGACRQANYWRQDTRWLAIAKWCGVVHQTCGDWLRGIKVKGGPRIKLAPGHLHPNFMRAKARLEACHRVAIAFRDKKTNTVGMILPEVLPGPHRDTRPVGWSQTQGGLLIPSGMAA
jgi:hypothetical protein